MPDYYIVKGKNGILHLNRQAVRNLLFSAEVENALTQVAAGIQGRAGNDYAVETFKGHDRVRAIVKPGTQAASEDNLENNTLLKAVNR